MHEDHLLQLHYVQSLLEEGLDAELLIPVHGILAHRNGLHLQVPHAEELLQDGVLVLLFW